MNLTIFLEGLIIGFSIAAPVGPIGILCIRRTLTGGRGTGFISGLGAATADAFYGGVAAFGLTFISGFLLGNQVLLKTAGGIFLLLMGARILPSHQSHKEMRKESEGFIGAYLSTFFLTLTNPMTILSFAAVFAGLGISGMGKNYFLATLLVSGVFVGSALWWLILSGSVGIFKERLSTYELWINRISGCVIMGFGILILLSLLLQ
jgi:threonine/homoserine/homoserine lactone efflux protein